MSDYEYDADYGDDYQYQEQQEIGDMEEENIEATIQIDYFNAEELIRQNKPKQALEAFKEIFSQADKNNLRNWKIKTVTQILEIHCQNKNSQQIYAAIESIKKINEKDKLTESAIRSIINILQTLPRNQYEQLQGQIFKLIENLDENGTLKSYILIFQKCIQEKDKEKSKVIYDRFREAIRKVQEISVGTQLQIYSLQIKYYKQQGRDIETKLRSIQLKLPLLQDEAHVNDNHLSFIKEEIAKILYDEGSYQQCTKYLCDSFCQNAKFGKSTEDLKQLLKVNVLALLLCSNQDLLTKREYNPLLLESASAFKMDQDIQALFGLIENFKELNLKAVEQIFKIVNMNLMNKFSAFKDICQRVTLQLKRRKLIYICKPYNRLTFDYIGQRIKESNSVIVDLLFDLINSNQINGIIHLEQRYLQILPSRSEYYTTQLANLRELTLRL